MCRLTYGQTLINKRGSLHRAASSNGKYNSCLSSWCRSRQLCRCRKICGYITFVCVETLSEMLWSCDAISQITQFSSFSRLTSWVPRRLFLLAFIRIENCYQVRREDKRMRVGWVLNSKPSLGSPRRWPVYLSSLSFYPFSSFLFQTYISSYESRWFEFRDLRRYLS